MVVTVNARTIARRITRDVLTAAANGPDPTLAAAATAELAARRTEELDRWRDAGTAMRESLLTLGNIMAEAAAPFRALAAGLTEEPR